MSYPIIGILGGSRSGKDTVASIINKFLGGVSVAQADPMKRFAKKIFGFTDQQLWGPSDFRNAIDERGSHDGYWYDVRARIMDHASDFFQAWGLELTKGYWNTTGGTWGGLGDNTPPPPGLVYYKAYLPLMEHFDDLRTNHRATFSPRIQLQKFGTEFGRALNRNLWSLQALGQAKRILDGENSYSATEGVDGRIAGKTMHIPSWVTITDVRFRNEALNIKDAGGLLVRVVNPEIEGAVNVGIAGHQSETELLSIPASWLDGTIRNDKRMGLDYLQTNLVPALLWDLNLGEYWPEEDDQ